MADLGQPGCGSQTRQAATDDNDGVGASACWVRRQFHERSVGESVIVQRLTAIAGFRSPARTHASGHPWLLGDARGYRTATEVRPSRCLHLQRRT